MIKAIKKTTELSTGKTSIYKLYTELSTLSTVFMCTKQMFCEKDVGKNVDSFI